MDRSPPLLAGRLSRRGLSWLAGAVLVVTPIELLMKDSIPFYLMIVARSAVLVALLLGLLTNTVGAINAGRIFLGLGLVDMVAAAAVTKSAPEAVVVEAIAYGTILTILTLLIAPSNSRRWWSFAVTGLITVTAGVRLMPGDELLFVQVIVVFVVHTSAILTLDAHTNRAEAAGAMAVIDPLTGLLNRRPAIKNMTAGLVAAAEGERTSSVIMADLDHFKQVNDTLGHEAGDDALRRVAASMSKHVHRGDTLCRWGGEEFLVMLSGTGSEEAALIAERMRADVERLGLTASFGVAEVRETNTVAEWVDRADSAMYLAKHNGRNRVFLDDQLAAALRLD